ncbi:primosomal protein N' family DNA-binding protein [Arthrobacter psychrolactophilus]
MEQDLGQGVQMSLLSGFVTKERIADPHSGVVLAPHLPVAQVVIDSPLPHLDRIFDYSVPLELDAEAQPGVRVRVKFSGQDLNGFLVARVDESESSRLVPLARVYSAVPVLAPHVLELARKVAARYAGTVADVLRVAVPPRVASLEKVYLKKAAELAAEAAVADTAEAAPPVVEPAKPGHSLFGEYPHAEDFLTQLAMGASPKAVFGALRGWVLCPGIISWPRLRRIASYPGGEPLWWCRICGIWNCWSTPSPPCSRPIAS